MAWLNKNLSDKEIDTLFKFVKGKYVHYEDLQHELVDHLACSIEELMKEDPELSFDKALQIVYSKFPLTGFTNLITEKSQALEKYWKTRFWQYYKSFFKLPKVLLTIGIVFILFKGISLPGFRDFLVPIYYTMMVLCGVLFVYTIKKGFYKKAQRYLVIGAYYRTMIVTTIMFYVQFYIMGSSLNHPVTLFVFSLLVVYSVITVYAQLFVFPKMLASELKQNYPFVAG
jgi:hypothetical protein